MPRDGPGRSREAPWTQAETRERVRPRPLAGAGERARPSGSSRARARDASPARPGWASAASGSPTCGCAVCRPSRASRRCSSSRCAPTSATATAPGSGCFSLEATNRLLVEAAKRRHRLPAYRAEISLVEDGGARWPSGRARRAPLRGPLPPRRQAAGRRARELRGSSLRALRALHRRRRPPVPGRAPPRAPGGSRPARLELEEATLVPVALEGDARALTAERQDLLVWPLVEL